MENNTKFQKEEPIDKLVKPFNNILKSGPAIGIILFLMAVIAMAWANSPWSESYFRLWKYKIAFSIGDFELNKTLLHWINDGLMAVFFFVIGLEIKREVLSGHLSSWKQAVLPLGAAIGGMVLPAAIYLAFNLTNGSSDGWGIPMATDIAFTLGLMAIVKSRVPVSIKIFLTALAIVDDLGAVLVIAFFYTSNISFPNLIIGAGFLSILLLGNRLKVRSTTYYAIFGIGGLWLAFLLSGVHATVAGVLAALTIPTTPKISQKGFIIKLKNLKDRFKKITGNEDDNILNDDQLKIIEELQETGELAESPLQKLERSLSPVVYFVIMPLFALANAGVAIKGDFIDLMLEPISLGIIFGLIFGKFIGIVGMSKLLVKLNIAQLPIGSKWIQIYGAAMLAGIGFTMSIFISNLAFTDKTHELSAKVGILIASFIAGVTGLIMLRFYSPSSKDKKKPDDKLSIDVEN